MSVIAINTQIKSLLDQCPPPPDALLASKYLCKAITTTLHAEIMSISYDGDGGAGSSINMVPLISSLSSSGAPTPSPRQVKLRGGANIPNTLC